MKIVRAASGSPLGSVTSPSFSSVSWVGGGRGAGAVKGVKREEEGVVWSSAARSDISTVTGGYTLQMLAFGRGNTASF